MQPDAITVSQQAVSDMDADRDGFVRRAQFECCCCQNPCGHRIFTHRISIPTSPANCKLRPSRSNRVVFGSRDKSNMHRPIRT